jgi:excisionase family DNA binding protein
MVVGRPSIRTSLSDVIIGRVASGRGWLAEVGDWAADLYVISASSHFRIRPSCSQRPATWATDHGNLVTTTGNSQGALTLYTTEEAAEILRVKKSWLERQAAARKIPFTMLGGGYKFTPAHLSVIVKMHEQTPAPPEWTVNSYTRSRRLSVEPRATNPGSPPLRPRPRNGPHRAA